MAFRRWWLCAALGLALLAGAWVAFRANERPDYGSRPLRGWLGALASDDYQARLEAEAALRDLGPEAIPELTQAVAARETALSAAWRRLWRAWAPAAGQRPSTEKLAIAAMGLLARFGPEAKPASGALTHYLTEGPPEAAREAEATLRRIGAPALASLTIALEEGTSSGQERVLRMLAGCDGTEFGSDLGELARRIVQLGQGTNVALRLHAVAAMGVLPVEDQVSVPFLTERLEDPEVTVRCTAARALAKIGPRAAVATSRLAGMLHSRHTAEQVEAAAAVWKIRGDIGQVLPALMVLLQDADARSAAAVVVSEIGRRAEAAVPTLLAELAQERSHRPSRTPSMLALALGKMGPAAVPGLARLAGHPQADVRINAAVALRGQGTNAAPAVPALIRMLQAEDLEERMTAANALGAVGRAAGAAEAELAWLAGETSSDVMVGHVASSARDALRRIRGPATPGLAATP